MNAFFSTLPREVAFHIYEYFAPSRDPFIVHAWLFGNRDGCKHFQQHWNVMKGLPKKKPYPSHPKRIQKTIRMENTIFRVVKYLYIVPFHNTRMHRVVFEYESVHGEHEDLNDFNALE